MNRQIYVDGRVVDAKEAKAALVVPGILHGKGVFTTVAVCGSTPMLWEKHWLRLIEDADRIGLDLLEHSEANIRAALDEIITKNGLTDGRARITCLDESPGSIWTFEGRRKTGLFIITGKSRPTAANFRLTSSPYQVNSRSPLARVKSCNYLENLIAWDEAKGRGFYEAIRLNEHGHVTSGCISNIFWSTGGRLFTPSRSTGCLPGTTRAYILENLECREVEAGIEALDNAEAIFLTSAGLGVVSVSEFKARALNAGRHAIVDLWPPK